MSPSTLYQSHKRYYLRRVKKLLFVFISAGFLVSVFYLAGKHLMMPDKVIVSGAENLSVESLRSSVKNQSLFVFSTQKLARNLKTAFPKIAEIKIKRNFFQKTFIIEIQERKPWAIWCGSSSCFYTDVSGVLFGEAPVFLGDLVLKITDERTCPKLGLGQSCPKPSLGLGEQFLETKYLVRLQDFMKTLEDSRDINTIDVTITSDLAFWLTTADGWRIFIDSETQTGQALENLDLMLGSAIKSRANLDYIDLRFENKGFYKLK